MKIKTYTQREMKKLLSQHPIRGSFNVYQIDEHLEKIYKDVMFDLQKYCHIMMPFSLVNEEQIRWLYSLQSKIYSSDLPSGILHYENQPIGVMYPKYYKDYKNCNELYEEPIEVMFMILKKAIQNNIELMNNGIYNYDFTMSNILYKNGDVKLIDLDGKYITNKEDYSKVYAYFIIGMISQIIKKIETQYKGKEQKLAIAELRAIIANNSKTQINEDYPFIMLQEIEEAKILKR